MKNIFLLLSIFIISINANEIAFAKNVKGDVFSQLSDKKTNLKNTQWVDEKSIISTKANSSVTLVFKDTSTLVLGENSILSLERFLFKPKTEKYKFELKLSKGTASFESGKIGKLSPNDFAFKTPESTVAIRGTKFIVNVQ